MLKVAFGTILRFLPLAVSWVLGPTPGRWDQGKRNLWGVELDFIVGQAELKCPEGSRLECCVAVSYVGLDSKERCRQRQMVGIVNPDGGVAAGEVAGGSGSQP